MNLLFLDTETTGMIVRGASPTDSRQPRLVQLGAQLVGERRETLGELNVLVKPDGWEIPADATHVHGITTQQATEIGIPILDVLAAVEFLIAQAGMVVGHNVEFDRLVVRSEFARASRPDPFLDRPAFCTMMSSVAACRIPGRYGQYKWPTLGEAHSKLLGQPVVGAHDALTDVKSCRAVYYALVDRAAAAATAGAGR